MVGASGMTHRIFGGETRIADVSGVRRIDHVWIPMSDGTRLAARIRRHHDGMTGLDAFLDEQRDIPREAVVGVVDEQVVAHLVLADAHAVVPRRGGRGRPT